MEIKRRTEVYKVLIEKKVLDQGNTDFKFEELLNPNHILDSTLEYYYSNYVHSETNDRKEKVGSNDICYYMSNVECNNSIRKVNLNYIKFNKNTKVVDIDSLTSRYKKGKNEGDEEYQHYAIKTYDNTNRAVLVFEKISGAVTIGMLKKTFNKAYKEWVKENYKDEENKEIRQELLKHEIKIKIVPSPDFIAELERLDKISLLKITVDKEKITTDDDINFAEENISRDDVDLIYKPIQGLSFSKSKVKKYYETFEKQSNKTKIKRMIISGRKDGNGISLDTEQMKLSKYIKAKVDIDGFIESEMLFNEYEKLINENFKEYFNNLFIDIDESEE